MTERLIVHVDMDEFFAAVEKLDNPALAGKPILVGGSADARGVVATASYEARAFGCRSAMPMATALRLCPHAIVVSPHGSRYGEFSGRVFDIFGRFTPLVEGLSVDEAFLDLTGCEKLFGSGRQVAQRIKQTIRDETGLTASVGVAPNKFLAKLASDLGKPDGLVVVTPRNVHDLLDPLPVSRIWGVGPAGVKAFERLGIRTIGQLRRSNVELLRHTFGKQAEHYLALASGCDDRPVVPRSPAKSIGQEQTFARDVSDPDRLRGLLLEQCQTVARRLRAKGLVARTVTLKIRYGDFTTLSRSHTLGEPTDVTDELWHAAEGVFQAWAERSFQPLRLLGMTASQLSKAGGRQLNLFNSPESQKQRQLDRTLDDIAGKFGNGVIRRGEGQELP